MRRTDRLFQLIQILRDGQRHTSAAMAGQLGVSTRTIWRDMEVLAASRVPVEGARGRGYRMVAPITLPPLALIETELEALRLGLSVVSETADSDLQAAARSLRDKIDAALPAPAGAQPAGWTPSGFPFQDAAKGFPHMPLLRQAIRERQKLRLCHVAPDRGRTERVVRPLQMEYWGRLWTLTAWCEARQDFRVFRVDRIESLSETGESFDDEPGKRLADHLARYAEGPYGN
jgi:predicted DNA-binding transcriptional regulator YafY